MKTDGWEGFGVGSDGENPALGFGLMVKPLTAGCEVWSDGGNPDGAS